MFLKKKKFVVFLHILLLCITTLKTSEVFCVGDSEAKTKNSSSNNQKIKTNEQKKKMLYECTFCYEIFSKENDLNRHKCRKTTEPIQKPSFECSVCKACFHKQSDLTTHELSHTLDTEEEKPFVCKICNADFKRKNNFKTHMINIHKEPFTEKGCGEAFQSVEALEQYKNSILYDQLFKCKKCTEYFQHEAQLIQHQIQEHQQTTKKVIYMCDHPGCNKTYMEQRNLWRHKNLKHLPCGEEVLNCADLKVHQQSCEQCQNVMKTKKLATIKAKQLPDNKITKSFQCDQCKKLFQYEAQLIQHQIQEHQQPPSKVIYKCDHPGCNKVYIERKYLNRHKNLKHLPCATIKAKQLPDNKITKAFQCDQCKKSFQGQVQLIQHQIQEHQQPSSKVIYKCDHPGCNKVYIERRDLCRHKSLKHLPCGAEFKDYSGLAVHRRHCHQCQNFAESKKLKTIKATQLTDDKILSAKDKADNTQPEENEPNGLAKQLIQNNDLNTTIEIMLSSQSIENNHSPDESESDNYVSWLIVSCPKLISTITNNLSIIKNFVDNHNYQDAASTFATAKTIISNLNKFFSKFKLIDSSCTKNKNTAKIDIMCNAFRCIEHLTLNSFIDQKCSMSYILQKTEEITKAMYEIFADWQLALQSKNHSAIQPESVVISENEDIENHSAIQYESAGLSENESPDLLISLVRDEDHLLPESEEFISLLSDLDNFLECDIEICSDLSLFQQIDTDILLNSE